MWATARAARSRNRWWFSRDGSWHSFLPTKHVRTAGINCDDDDDQARAKSFFILRQKSVKI